MLPIRIVVLTVVLATPIVAPPAGAVWAQLCGAYTDEIAGPGGTYTSPEECAAEGEPVTGVGISGPPMEPTLAGRDDPDAPPVYRDTATFEGEREP